VLIGMDPASEFAGVDTAGPVVSVVPFSTGEDMVSMVNSVAHCKTARVHTADLARAHDLIGPLDVGSLSFGDDGILSKVDPVRVEEYLRIKNVFVDLTA
jgi:acyl-CoA reductase-like NAD-dependent aldehyde dehydrogenase